MTSRRRRPRDTAVVIVMIAWVVAVAGTEHAAALTPLVVSCAAAAR